MIISTKERMHESFLRITGQETKSDSSPCGDTRSGNPQIRVN